MACRPTVYSRVHVVSYCVATYLIQCSTLQHNKFLLSGNMTRVRRKSRQSF